MAPEEGGARLGRFLLLTGPAGVACLGVVAGIALGWISVAFATVEPMQVVSTSGTADRLQLGLGSDRSVTGLAVTGRARPAAVLRLGEGELEDLCLVPRLRLPGLGEVASLRIATGRRVGLADTTLAAAEGRLGGLDVPRATIGPAPVGSGGAGFTVANDPSAGDVRLHDADLAAYGLVLDGGLDLRSLTLRPALGEQGC